MEKQVVVAVLAGGASVRMGMDKAAVDVGGESLLMHVCRAVEEAGLPVCVIGRPPDDPALVKLGGAVAVADEVPGLGPIGGLLTALRSAPENVDLLLTACDLPLVEPAQFTWLANFASAQGTSAADGIVPLWKGRPEPLFALYRRSIIPMVERHIAMRRYGMQDLVQAGAFIKVSLPPEHMAAIRDVDTPEELRDAIRGF